MEARELRIGNFVSDIFASESFFGEVKKLDYSRCYYGKFHSSYSDLKPIHLTEEWLLKFGFEKGAYAQYNCLKIKQNQIKEAYLFCNFIDVEIFNSGIALVDDFDVETEISLTLNIKYVHQLQNLYFALSGQELEIKEP